MAAATGYVQFPTYVKRLSMYSTTTDNVAKQTIYFLKNKLHFKKGFKILY